MSCLNDGKLTGRYYKRAAFCLRAASALMYASFAPAYGAPAKKIALLSSAASPTGHEVNRVCPFALRWQ